MAKKLFQFILSPAMITFLRSLQGDRFYSTEYRHLNGRSITYGKSGGKFQALKMFIYSIPGRLGYDFHRQGMFLFANRGLLAQHDTMQRQFLNHFLSGEFAIRGVLKISVAPAHGINSRTANISVGDSNRSSRIDLSLAAGNATRHVLEMTKEYISSRLAFDKKFGKSGFNSPFIHFSALWDFLDSFRITEALNIETNTRYSTLEKSAQLQQNEGRISPLFILASGIPYTGASKKINRAFIEAIVDKMAANASSTVVIKGITDVILERLEASRQASLEGTIFAPELVSLRHQMKASGINMSDTLFASLSKNYDIGFVDENCLTHDNLINLFNAGHHEESNLINIADYVNRVVDHSVNDISESLKIWLANRGYYCLIDCCGKIGLTEDSDYLSSNLRDFGSLLDIQFNHIGFSNRLRYGHALTTRFFCTRMYVYKALKALGRSRWFHPRPLVDIMDFTDPMLPKPAPDASQRILVEAMMNCFGNIGNPGSMWSGNFEGQNVFDATSQTIMYPLLATFALYYDSYNGEDHLSDFSGIIAELDAAEFLSGNKLTNAGAGKSIIVEGNFATNPFLTLRVDDIRLANNKVETVLVAMSESETATVLNDKHADYSFQEGNIKQFAKYKSIEMDLVIEDANLSLQSVNFCRNPQVTNLTGIYSPVI